MRIEGEVRFADLTSDLQAATVYVRLLDVSRADAPSETVAEQTISGVSADLADPGNIRFSLEAPDLERTRSYTLAAHVDVTGSREIEAGDYITMQAVPVTPESASGPVVVPVRPVR